MGAVEIVAYDPGWPGGFAEAARRLRGTLGEDAARIDHIGSTAVPGLASKNVIDVQVSIQHASRLDEIAERLGHEGWTQRRSIHTDHAVPGWPAAGGGPKVFLREPAGGRRVNVHVRVLGMPNQRYPIVVRDYLRAHPDSALAYATLKRDLGLVSTDHDRYADMKDAACDLIYLAAEDWAATIDWVPGPSDA